MTDWSSSHFLQALGWATLNSFWQMALLWCLFQLLTYFVKLTSNQKYLLAVSSVFVGFVWFVLSFSIYYSSGFSKTALHNLAVEIPTSVLSIVLSCASVAYLLLLVVPTVRIVRNWHFLKQIKTVGLDKVPYRYRLFTQRIASHLGITKPVKVYLSALVSSPMTIGFLKPIILIPIASVNQLSTQQLEAILLHELSHIRRQDYIVNLLLSFIQTILYFNPFIRFFIERADVERENCCDELVLQFEYDKHSYAAALLQLEKNAQGIPELAMAAANKNYLLHRIEKIVGIYKKPTFNTYHFSGAFAVVLMLLVINSVLIAGKEKLTVLPFHDMSEPFAFFINNDKEQEKTLPSEEAQHVAEHALAMKEHTIAMDQHVKATLKEVHEADAPVPETPLEPAIADNPAFIHVALDEADAALNKEQKDQVSKAVVDTRKALELSWIELEKSIGNDMTAAEKSKAKKEYLAEISKINWENYEKGLKNKYDIINWDEMNQNLTQSIALAKADSIRAVCNEVTVQLNKLKVAVQQKQLTIIPDASVKQVEKVKADIQKQLDELKKLETKKVIRL
jgi:bla regulator protein BlaR1